MLLLDETSIEDIAKIFSVQRLCLSRNEKISCLPDLIKKFSPLQWLDLKKAYAYSSVSTKSSMCRCTRGCSSLKTVEKPLVRSIPSTFIFTNCNELEQATKEEISAYAERKCQLLSSALKRCDEVSLFVVS